MRRLIIFILCVVLLISAYVSYKLNPERVSSVPGEHYGMVKKEAINASINQLNSNPQKYNGKLVRVKGYAYFHKEGNAIYISKNQSSQKNGSLIVGYDYNELGIEEIDIYKRFHRKLVLIEGIYNSSGVGWWGIEGGAIENVTRVDLWEDKLWR